ncbi:5-formyltetrahydrofolate cyclo-ligase [Asaia sp. BMEF1]|uniref:5-formyltetrahydrofolate cyclo-ligase n=1 Tax=Asaia sp. BMEF1 TaxID=3155932 RepID=UPI003F66975F
MNSDQQKHALRQVIRRRRIENPVSPQAQAELIESLASIVLSNPEIKKIGCVWPLPGEADLRPLCVLLNGAGRDVLLPETTLKGHPLFFRRWKPDAVMLEGRFGTMHPDGAVDRPDMLLVPLLAFDRSGNRLGYGGGYYDRTLATLRCRSIGFAFAWQEVAQVPLGAYDEPLDWIVTEKEILAGQAGKGGAE